MRLIRTVLRARNILLRDGWALGPVRTQIYGSPSRNIQTSALCRDVERKYKKQVFTPAFGNSESPKVEEEEVTQTRKTESDIYLEQKGAKKKVREFKKFDKMMLVFLGKYKRIEDVPDRVTFTTLERKKEVDDEMRHLFMGTAFKYVYTFEYASFFITGAILMFALYWYNEVKKSENSKSAEKETSSTTE